MGNTESYIQSKESKEGLAFNRVRPKKPPRPKTYEYCPTPEPVPMEPWKPCRPKLRKHPSGESEPYVMRHVCPKRDPRDLLCEENIITVCKDATVDPCAKKKKKPKYSRVQDDPDDSWISPPAPAPPPCPRHRDPCADDLPYGELPPCKPPVIEYNCGNYGVDD